VLEHLRSPAWAAIAARAYVTKPDSLHLEHNHFISRSLIDGIVTKQRSSELTAEEKASIFEISPFVSIGTLRRIFRSTWPNIGFDSELLYRWKKKAKEKIFGSDRDAINYFMEKGQQITAEKGVFDVRFDELMKIEEVYVQTQSMAAYARQYEDFTILDCTFRISLYDSVLMVFSNVDCLMKSVVTGFVLALSERSDTVVRAAHLFSLDSEQTVIMTDQASAFISVACQLKRFTCYVFTTSELQCSAPIPE
jgi:hypothetical protein